MNSCISEAQDLIINSRRQARKSRVVRKIVEDVWLVPEDLETQLVDGQDAWVFSRHLKLPRTLHQCVQTVNSFGFKIKHQIHFHVKLVNPDGHTSEVLDPYPVNYWNETLTCRSCMLRFLSTYSFPPTCLSTIILLSWTGAHKLGYLTPLATEPRRYIRTVTLICCIVILKVDM